MRSRLALTAALLGTQAAFAGTDVWFTPLTQSAPVVPANSLGETSSPWVTPEGIHQKNILSLREVEDQILSPGQSVIRVPGQGTSASMFDMLAYDPTGQYLFIPHETPIGAGCTRISLYDNHAEVILAGDQKGANGDWSNDFGAFDPSRWTPNGTLFLAEEWSGEGRVIEILNPLAPAAEIESRELNSIPNVSHEGINFSEKFEDTIYFIDEYNSGSIYKFVMSKKGDYTKGQSFVLSVDAFLSSGGNPVANYNAGSNATAVREGMATWIPLTDKNGVPLPGISDPFVNGPTGPATLAGRKAADDAGGTPYGRPEDMAVGRATNGREMLYVAVTSENAVISIEILENRKGNSYTATGKAIVRVMANNSTPKNLGYAPTTGTISSPDNIALDSQGNVYVIEDAPNGSSTGGDIWFFRDKNSDGVAESVDHFMSIRVHGSEATGMIFNPANPLEFCVSVQHPTSTDLAVIPNGLGDAVWMFNLANIPNKGFVKNLEKGRTNTNQ
ncbi:alkaline phosphatase PhoX [Luteolibacter arcticus]|uniref:alkaline phosphatase PhoX n=1 Tax=Luteolibacter arcticus TaxID=1581411 RepID=UPI0022239312|nr:alkaline phosphatase PhoX [Luteolibacter arcticus]